MEGITSNLKPIEDKGAKRKQHITDIATLSMIVTVAISVGGYFTDSVILGHLKNNTKDNIENVISSDRKSLQLDSIIDQEDWKQEWEQQGLSSQQIEESSQITE